MRKSAQAAESPDVKLKCVATHAVFLGVGVAVQGKDSCWKRSIGMGKKGGGLKQTGAGRLSKNGKNLRVVELSAL